MARFALLLAFALGVALLAPKADAIMLQATIGQVTGGSCGYANYPPGYLVTGFSEAIYYNGEVCGACYKIQCFGSPQCIPGRAVNVMVTSICQSTNTTDVCNTGSKALNLDPRAWDLIVKTRALGSVPVSVFSVPCPAMAGGVQFNVSVATQYYMQVLIQNVGGMGRVSAVYATTNGVQVLTPCTATMGPSGPSRE